MGLGVQIRQGMRLLMRPVGCTLGSLCLKADMRLARSATGSRFGASLSVRSTLARISEDTRLYAS